MSSPPSPRAGRPRRSIGQRLVAAIAEMCLIVGSLACLYAVWELWWTEVVGTASAVQEARQITANPEWVSPPDRNPSTPQHGVGEPPRLAALRTATTATPLGVLHIPRFGADYQRGVYEGTDRSEVLNALGFGHYPGTAGPGELGNFAIAGHRVTYSQPLRRIADLRTGDAIVFESADTWYVYRVSKTGIVVTPEHGEYVAPVPGDTTARRQPHERILTLTACHPLYSAAERFITHATLSYWMPKRGGTPPELLEKP